MQKVVLNSELHKVLPTLTEDAVIIDDAGNRVGMFITAAGANFLGDQPT